MRKFKRSLGRYLSFRKEYIKPILSGKKKTTIRLGIVTPRHSRVYLESEGKVYGELSIESTEYVKFSELTEKDAACDGFETLNDLKKALESIYNRLRDDDWLTVIHFDVVQRYDKPVTRDEIEQSFGNLSFGEIARLGLAYSTYTSSLERRVLTAVAYFGDIEDALKTLGENVSYSQVVKILKQTYRKLSKLGVIKTS